MKRIMGSILAIMLITTSSSWIGAVMTLPNYMKIPVNEVEEFNVNHQETKIDQINNVNDNNCYENNGQILVTNSINYINNNNPNGGYFIDNFIDDSFIEWNMSDNINIKYNDLKLNTTKPFNVDNHTLAYWDFEERSGTTVHDVSGNNNNGTIIGAKWVNGKFGYALSLIGVNKDRVEFPNSTTLDIQSNFTIEAWIKTFGGLDNHQCIIDKLYHDDSANIAYGYSFYTSGNVIRLSTYGGSNGNGDIYGNSWITNNAWHYVVGTYNGTNNLLYVDGSLDGNNQNVIKPASTSNKLAIGNRLSNHGTQGRYDGIIDDIRISNISRTSNEIKNNYDRIYRKLNGNITSKPITLPQGMKWDTFLINKTQSKISVFNITILNASNNEIIANTPTFTSSGEFDISYIDPEKYSSIKLRGEIYSNSGVYTPLLHFWGVSWNRSDSWCDTFFGGLKIQESNNVSQVEGKASFFNNGSMTSTVIKIPNEHYLNKLIINKSIPTNYFLNISIIDNKTNLPIPGFEDITENTKYLSGFDTSVYSSIKLRANFESNGNQLGNLSDWSLNWTKNTPPIITNINEFNQVKRTDTITIKIDLADQEEQEHELTLNISYKGPSDATYRNDYLSTPFYNVNSWKCNFIPPKDASLGTYSFKFSCNDSFQYNDSWSQTYNVEVLNNKPTIWGITPSVSYLNRTETSKIYTHTSDKELGRDELKIDVFYKSPIDTQWKNEFISNKTYFDSKWIVDFTPTENAEIGLYIFSIICNDTHSEVFGETNINVVNNIPLILSVIPNSLVINRTESIIMTIDAYDKEKKENELNVSVMYKSYGNLYWDNKYITSFSYKNGNWEAVFNPPRTAYVGLYLMNISCDDTETTVYENVQIWVNNNIPSQPEVTIIPDEPTTIDDLLVNVTNIYDIENNPDNIEIWYRWYKNEEYISDFDNFSKIPSSITKKHEKWKCEVTLFDGTDFGPQNIDDIIIINSIPMLNELLDQVTINEDETDDTSIDLNKIFIDSDFDVLEFKSEGQKNIEISISENSGKVKLTPLDNWFGNEKILFSANDSEDEISQLITVTVQPVNDPPIISITAPVELEVTQLETTTLDFTEYVDDIDNDTSELSLIVNSEYADLDSLIIIFNYTGIITKENVEVIATDGIDKSIPHIIVVSINIIDSILPKIIENFPTGKDVPISTSIITSFNTQMDHTSVENAFSIVPGMEGTFTWKNNTMIFKPTSDLSYDTEYTISITKMAKNLKGSQIGNPVTWNFTTLQFLDTDGDDIPDDEDPDDDNDGILDEYEITLGTDPALKDTDGDGYDDKLDAYPLDSTKWEKKSSEPDKESKMGMIIGVLVIIIVIVILLFLFIIKPKMGKKIDDEKTEEPQDNLPEPAEIQQPPDQVHYPQTFESGGPPQQIEFQRDNHSQQPFQIEQPAQEQIESLDSSQQKPLEEQSPQYTKSNQT